MHEISQSLLGLVWEFNFRRSFVDFNTILQDNIYFCVYVCFESRVEGCEVGIVEVPYCIVNVIKQTGMEKFECPEEGLLDIFL